jgi:membrane protein
LLVTILGFVPDGDPDLQAKLIDSTLVQFPVISSQLRENVHSLKGSGIGLAVGILATLYGRLGAAGATQNAFNRAWRCPVTGDRIPSPLGRAACCCCPCSAPACSRRLRSRG